MVLKLIIRLLSDFPENAIKGILKHMLITLPRYHDKKSRNAVEGVIRSLAKNHGDKLPKIFCSILNDFAQEQKNIAPRYGILISAQYPRVNTSSR